MRSSNPTFSNAALNRIAYGSNPSAGAAGDLYDATGNPYGATDDPYAIPSANVATFTHEGVIHKTILLLAILVASGLTTVVLLPPVAHLPVLILGTVLVLGAVITVTFKPGLAKIVAPFYAVVEGAVLGLLSAVFEANYPGIVVTAVTATGVTFAVMLMLYRTGVVKVTARFRAVVVGATVAIFAFYMLQFVLSFFSVGMGFSSTNGSLISIGVSVVVIIVAALNLMLDFDFIDRAERNRLPASAEWYGAFGLIVTLVWLYVEFLRLIAKFSSRD